MTKQKKQAIEPRRDRPEIKVTPFMLEVGTFVLAEYVEICPPDLLVTKVYRAMREAELTAQPPADPRTDDDAS